MNNQNKMEDTMRHDSAPQQKQTRTKDDVGLIKDMATINSVTNSVELKTRNNRNLFAKTQKEFNNRNSATPLKIMISETQDTQKRRPFKLAPLKHIKVRADSQLNNKAYLQIYASATVETEKLPKQSPKVAIKRSKRNSPTRPRPTLKIEEIDDTQRTVSTPKSMKGENELGSDTFDLRKVEKSAMLKTTGFGATSNQTSTNSVFESLSVRSIQKSRMKIEEDVNRLHSRVRLLIHEEERALKLIQETRDKAETILRLKMESQQFKEQLAIVREKDRQTKTDQVRKRNEAASEHPSRNGSIITFRSKANELQQIKLDDAHNLKHQISKALKKAKKTEKRNLKLNQSRRNEILIMEHHLKDQQENIVLKKSTSVRRQKESQIKDEILKIHKKNNEAKSLVKEEHKILSRLRETQNLQKETISHIKELFVSLNQEFSPQLNRNELNQHSRFLDSMQQLCGVVEEKNESVKSPDKDD